MAPHSYRDTLKRRGLQPFLWTQFLGAFNDNLFKIVVSMLAVRTATAAHANDASWIHVREAISVTSSVRVRRQRRRNLTPDRRGRGLRDGPTFDHQEVEQGPVPGGNGLQHVPGVGRVDRHVSGIAAAPEESTVTCSAPTVVFGLENAKRTRRSLSPSATSTPP